MRQKLGMAFLLITICLVITSINLGGWWWLAVMCATLATLWGIGFTSENKKPPQR